MNQAPFPQQQIKMKIIIVGDSGVGKTNLRMRFCHNTFNYLSQSTVGIQYSRRRFWSPIQNNNNIQITGCFWDAAGKFNQNQLLPSFFKNIIGIIYVFDLTKQQSLQNLKMWKSLINDHINVNKVSQILIGNKNDLIYLRQVSMLDAQKFKKQMNIPLYFQTSAMHNINVNQTFFTFLSQIAKQATLGIKKPLKLKKKQNFNRCYY